MGFSPLSLRAASAEEGLLLFGPHYQDSHGCAAVGGGTPLAWAMVPLGETGRDALVVTELLCAGLTLAEGLSTARAQHGAVFPIGAALKGPLC